MLLVLTVVGRQWACGRSAKDVALIQMNSPLPAVSLRLDNSLPGRPADSFHLQAAVVEWDLYLLHQFPEVRHIEAQVSTEWGLAQLRGFNQVETLRLYLPDSCTDANLAFLGESPALETLELDGGAYTPAVLRRLEGLQKLANVKLSRNKLLAGAGLEVFTNLPALKSLTFAETGFAGRDFTPLEAMNRLTHLVIRDQKFDDDAMSHLRGLSRLRELHIWSREISDVGLVHLKNLTALSTLHLSGDGITDAGLKNLTSLQSLTTLEIRGPKLTDGAIDSLVALKSLGSLSINGSSISDKGLMRLAKLPLLTTISIPHAKITPAGEAAFKKVRPAVWLMLR
jgi:hypothetical protein